MSVGRGEESADKGAGLQLDGLSGPHSTCLCFQGGEVYNKALVLILIIVL